MRWKSRALALHFSTILTRMYLGSEAEADKRGAEIVFLVDSVAFCITLVRLETAKSMSSGVFNFMFKLISVLTNSQNLE